jgi:glycosyltransferase involved in cell wall biosynthesis
MTDEPFRILLVHNSADIYGASRSLLRLLTHLDRSKFRPLVVLPEDGPLRPLLERTGVEVVLHDKLSILKRPVFRSWRILQFFWEFPGSVRFLRRMIRKHHIDLVHTNTGIIASSGLAARLAGVPHVWHIRDWFQEFGPLWTLYRRYILWSSSSIIAVSRAIAGQFPESKKISVIHNGFPLSEFMVDQAKIGAEFRSRFSLNEAFVVGCVGRIKRIRKGQEVLVQAAARLKARGHSAKYIIVGSPFPGNEAHLIDLKKQIGELGLEEDIILTGEMEDVRPAYAAMDVLVLPSAQPEPFGGVVMEAMAMGLPVIATNIGGSPDQVSEGITGFLVPPGDPEALAEKLELLIRDPGLRARLGAAGPERIAKHFSVEGMVEAIQRIYCRSRQVSF